MRPLFAALALALFALPVSPARAEEAAAKGEWVAPTNEGNMQVWVPAEMRVLAPMWLHTRIDNTTIDVKYEKAFIFGPAEWFKNAKRILEQNFYIKGGKVVDEPRCTQGDVDICVATVTGKFDGTKSQWTVAVGQIPRGGAGVAVLIAGTPADLAAHAESITAITTKFRAMQASIPPVVASAPTPLPAASVPSTPAAAVPSTPAAAVEGTPLERGAWFRVAGIAPGDSNFKNLAALAAAPCQVSSKFAFTPSTKAPGYFDGIATCWVAGKPIGYVFQAVSVRRDPSGAAAMSDAVAQAAAPAPAAHVPDAPGARFTGDVIPLGQRFRILEISANDITNYASRAALIGKVCTPKQKDPMGRSRKTPGFYTGIADCSGTVVFLSDVAATLVDDAAQPEDAAGNYAGRNPVPRGQRFYVTGSAPGTDPDGKLKALAGKVCVADASLWVSRSGPGFFGGSMRCEGTFVSMEAGSIRLAGVVAVPRGAAQIVATGTKLPQSRLAVVIPPSAGEWHVTSGGFEKGPSDRLSRGTGTPPPVSINLSRNGSGGCAMLAKGAGAPPGPRPSWLPQGWTYLWSEDAKQTEKDGAACFADPLDSSFRAEITFGLGVTTADKAALSEVMAAILTGVDPTTLPAPN